MRTTYLLRLRPYVVMQMVLDLSIFWSLYRLIYMTLCLHRSLIRKQTHASAVGVMYNMCHDMNSAHPRSCYCLLLNETLFLYI